MPAAVAALLLLVATAALAAPTCLNKSGDTVRCDARDAMPVGWAPSPQQIQDWQMARPPGPSTGDVLRVVLGIVLLLALIALLPEFDGSRNADWETRDDDEEERR